MRLCSMSWKLAYSRKTQQQMQVPMPGGQVHWIFQLSARSVQGSQMSRLQEKHFPSDVSQLTARSRGFVRARSCVNGCKNFCYHWNVFPHSQFFIIFQFNQGENVRDAIRSFKGGIELFHKVALPPHKDLHIAQESLRACLATAGNTFDL